MAPGTAGVDVTVARAHGLGVSESKSRLPLGMPYAARASIMPESQPDARAAAIARGPEEHVHSLRLAGAGWHAESTAVARRHRGRRSVMLVTRGVLPVLLQW